MDKFLGIQNEQKIIDLLASDEPANELIALEIIKQSEDLKPHLGMLLVILSGAKDEVDWAYRYSYVKPLIDLETRQYLDNGHRHSGKYKFTALSFLEFCGRQVSLDMTYIQFCKDPSKAPIFLQLDQDNHPKRKEVFQSFLEQNSTEENVHWIKIDGLDFDELELLLAKLFSISNINPIPHLNFRSYKSKSVPEILFTRKYTTVTVEFTYATPFFPSFLFQLQGVQKLTLPFHKDWKLPTDWSRLNDLKTIDFYNIAQGFVFDNFDFIDTLPLLEKVNLALHYLSNPYILIRKRLPNFPGLLSDLPDFKFKKGLGFSIKLPPSNILKVGEALGNSDLDNQQRKIYFKKLLRLKRMEDAQWLPLDDIKVLINVPNFELQKTLKNRLEQRGIKVIEKEIEIKNQEDENLYRLIYSKSAINDSLAFEIIKNKEDAKRFLSAFLILLAASENVADAEFRFKFIAPFLTKNQQKYIGSKIQLIRGQHYQIYNLQRLLDRKTSIEYAYINFRRTGIAPLVFTLED